MNSDKQQKIISKRLWSKQEDQCLLRIKFENSVQKWCQIAKLFNTQMNFINSNHVARTNKQCRQRWQNHLNPELHNKQDWSERQHEELFLLFKTHSHKWSEIGVLLTEKGFQKRGDNNIKNYFYSMIKKGIKKMNEFIRKHNKLVKQKKSEKFNYNQRYAYKKRLSLQRQLLGSTVYKQAIKKQDEQQIQQSNLADNTLRILKDLNQDIVNKILLIAEEKGKKKFIMNQQNCYQQTVLVRDQFIDFIEKYCRPNKKSNDIVQIQSQDQNQLTQSWQLTKIINLAISILQISRKCKRKSNKNNHDFQNSKINKQEQSQSLFKIQKPKHYSCSSSSQNYFSKIQKYNNSFSKNLNDDKMQQLFQVKKDNKQIIIPIAQKKRSNDSLNNSCRLDQVFNPYANPCFNPFGQTNNFQKIMPSLQKSNEILLKSFGSLNYGLVSFLMQPKSIAYNFQIGQTIPQVSQKLNSVTHKGQSSFLNSMEVKPNNTIMADWPQIFPSNQTNFIGNLLRQNQYQNDVAQRPLSSSQQFFGNRQNSHRSRSHRSGQSKNKSQKGQFDVDLFGMRDPLGSSQIMMRSWGYSDKRQNINQINNLSNSNIFQQLNPNDLPLFNISKQYNQNPFE